VTRTAGSGWSSSSVSTLTPDPRLPHHPGMDRRRFLLTSLAGALAMPRASEAQQPGRMYRIGVLSSGGPDQERSLVASLRELLREVDGSKVRILSSNCATRTRYTSGPPS